MKIQKGTNYAIKVESEAEEIIYLKALKELHQTDHSHVAKSIIRSVELLEEGAVLGYFVWLSPLKRIKKMHSLLQFFAKW